MSSSLVLRISIPLSQSAQFVSQPNPSDEQKLVDVVERPMEPAQQLMDGIIGRMKLVYNVSSELGDVGCHMNWLPIVELGCVTEIISTTTLGIIIVTGNHPFGYHLGCSDFLSRGSNRTPQIQPKNQPNLRPQSRFWFIVAIL
nr:hypothetical protein HmN_000463800 [Hymenolepis microstoma]